MASDDRVDLGSIKLLLGCAAGPGVDSDDEGGLVAPQLHKKRPAAPPAAPLAAATAAAVDGEDECELELYDKTRVPGARLLYQRDASESAKKRKEGKGPLLVAVAIVKNESNTIGRMLESMLWFCDALVICDTGSSDDTVAKIRAFAETHDWDARIYHVPWRNFGHNRSVAVKVAHKFGDYLVLTDADYVWHRTDGAASLRLEEDGKCDVYHVGTMGDNIYYRQHVIRSSIRFGYKGRTHEHVDFFDGQKVSERHLMTLRILHMGDGGCKGDKFTRDVRFLTEDLAEFGERHARTLFYMAQTKEHMHAHAEAVDWYRRRIAVGDFKEENAISRHHIGRCTQALSGSSPHAAAIFLHSVLPWYLDSFLFHPERCEALHDAVHELRQSRHKLACALGGFAFWNNFPSPNCMFVDKATHEWRLWDSMAIACGYCAEYLVAGTVCMSRLLTERRYPEHDMGRWIKFNLRWYLDRWRELLPAPAKEQKEDKEAELDLDAIERQRQEAIRRGDTARALKNWMAAVAAYREAVPLLPLAFLARWIWHRRSLSCLYVLPRLDKLTGYREAKPLYEANVSISALLVLAFRSSGKPTGAAQQQPAPVNVNVRQPRDDERDLRRAHAQYWLADCRRKAGHSAVDTAGDWLDAAKLAIGTPLFSAVLSAMQRSLYEDADFGPNVASLVQLVLRCVPCSPI